LSDGELLKWPGPDAGCRAIEEEEEDDDDDDEEKEGRGGKEEEGGGGGGKEEEGGGGGGGGSFVSYDFTINVDYSMFKLYEQFGLYNGDEVFLLCGRN